MTFDDLRKSWQNEVGQPASTADLQQLVASVQRDVGSLERKIHGRDVREILAAIFVVVGFTAMWPFYRSLPVVCLGVAIILVATPFIVYVYLSAQRPTPTPLATSILEFSRQRLVWLDRQIHLRQTVFWWNVAPLLTGAVLVGWGATSGRRMHFVILMLVNLLVLALSIYLSRRAVRNELMPVRCELVALVESLEPTGDN